MYDISDPRSAPKVRITMMLEALGRAGRVESITGGRFGRAARAFRWLVSGGPRRVGAVYVEAPTSSPMPTDLAFLALMRLLRRPVGVYFRDAYPRFRDVHPRTSRRQVLTDLLWRATLPLLKGVASVRFVPSEGLAAGLGISDAVLLPPGTDPAQPFLGAGEDDVVGAIVQLGPTSGFDLLFAAMEIVRRSRPDARLVVVSRTVDPAQAAALPAWVRIVASGRSSLAETLASARVCVLPLPINRYTDFAVAVRLYDLAALGKPIVATATGESRRFLDASGAGLATDETADAMADAISRLLADPALARSCSERARGYATDPANTWDARALTVRARLLGTPA